MADGKKETFERFISTLSQISDRHLIKWCYADDRLIDEKTLTLLSFESKRAFSDLGLNPNDNMTIKSENMWCHKPYAFLKKGIEYFHCEVKPGIGEKAKLREAWFKEYQNDVSAKPLE